MNRSRRDRKKKLQFQTPSYFKPIMKPEPSTTIETIEEKKEQWEEEAEEEEDDEPDEWDQRIINTGCHKENLKLQLCHADTGDWRQCTKELQAFKECWDKNKNNERTLTVDN